MKEILFFIFNNMTDYEITFAMHMINTSKNKKVVVIAYEDTEIIGRSGAVYKPHRLVSDLKNIDSEGLIICGGWYGVLKPELSNLIKTLHEKRKLLAGICGAGTYLLAKSGILETVKFTTPIIEWTENHKQVFGDIDIFPRKNYIAENVVRDENIITSLGNSFINFTGEILDWYGDFNKEHDKTKFLDYMKQ